MRFIRNSWGSIISTAQDLTGCTRVFLTSKLSDQGAHKQSKSQHDTARLLRIADGIKVTVSTCGWSRPISAKDSALRLELRFPLALPARCHIFCCMTAARHHRLTAPQAGTIWAMLHRNSATYYI